MFRPAMVVLLAGACSASPVRGDWIATSATFDGATSVASGIMEVDADGETVLSATLTGEGPEGTLEATGNADLDETGAELSLIGTWTTQEGATPVGVAGPCFRTGDTLDCGLDVDGQAWMLKFDREGALD